VRADLRRCSRTPRPAGKKQDPGIPNLYPFKEALLDKIQRQQERLEEAKETQRSMREKMAAKRRAEIAKNVREAANNVAGAYARAPEAAPEELKGNARDLNRKKWFMRDLRKVLEESDVILEVLDARDPLGCRCPDIERLILGSCPRRARACAVARVAHSFPRANASGRYSQRAARPKRIILVLNKIDLVPPDVVAAWVQYLRREFPTIAFKSSTQGQSSHLAQRDLSMRKLKGASLCAVLGSLRAAPHSRVAEGEGRAAASSGAFGANALVMLLKKYSLSLGIKTAINVGVIGYPNVGKSSIVNSLKRQRSVGVSATPGFTRQLQYVRLDQHVMLVDSPGVIFSAEEEDSDLLLRNCLRVEQLQDPERAVALLLSERAHSPPRPLARPAC
jgi:nuclear GTP-binding protein